MMAFMKLHEYLSSPGALTVSELCNRIGAKSDAQLRQWQHGYADRRPNPENCLALEKATNGKVTRQDLRPNDYWLIWPDLAAPVSVLAEKQVAWSERRKADLEAEPVEGMQLESRSAADKLAANTAGVL